MAPVERLRAASTGGFASRGEPIRTVAGTFPTTGSSPEERARGFIADHAEAFGVVDADAELALAETRDMRGGGTVVVFQSVIGGIPVFGAGVRVHLDRAGNVIFVAADLPAEREVIDTPVIDAAAAATAAIGSVGGPPGEVSAGTPEVLVLNTGLIVDEPSGSRLAWRVHVAGPAPEAIRDVFVDAGDGAILLSEPAVSTARMRATYNCNEMSDMAALRSPGGTAELWYLESDMPVPGAMPSIGGREAHINAGRVYDYFHDQFVRDGIDDAGSEIQTYVHYGYVDPAGGSEPWAGWGDGAMWLSTGMSDLDVQAHEMTHGILGHEGGPGPYGFPGAVGESLADAFAMFVADYHGVGDPWRIGESSAAAELGSDGQRSIRDLADPTHLGDPRTMRQLASIPRGAMCGPLLPSCPAGWECMAGICRDVTDDAGKTHTNANIPGHAVYLLVNGGTDDDVDVTGIGRVRAEQIYYELITERFLGEHTGLAGLRDAVRAACVSLVGFPTGDGAIDWRDCGRAINAFAAVGIGEKDTDEDSWDDDFDNCVDMYNPLQEDTDGNGVGDLCEGVAMDGGTPDSGPPPAYCPLTLTSSLREYSFTGFDMPTVDGDGFSHSQCRYDSAGGLFSMSLTWAAAGSSSRPCADLPSPSISADGWAVSTSGRAAVVERGVFPGGDLPAAEVEGFARSILDRLEPDAAACTGQLAFTVFAAGREHSAGGVAIPTTVALNGFVFWPVNLSVRYVTCPAGLVCMGDMVTVTRDEYLMSPPYQWPTQCMGMPAAPVVIEQEITAVDAMGKTDSMTFTWGCRP